MSRQGCGSRSRRQGQRTAEGHRDPWRRPSSPLLQQPRRPTGQSAQERLHCVTSSLHGQLLMPGRPRQLAKQTKVSSRVHTPPLQEHRPQQGAPGAPSIPPTDVQTLPPSLRQPLAPTGQRCPQAAAGPREEGPEGCSPELRKLLTWGDSQGTQVSGGTPKRRAHQRLFPCRALRSEVSAAGTRRDHLGPPSAGGGAWGGPTAAGRATRPT